MSKRQRGNYHLYRARANRAYLRRLRHTTPCASCGLGPIDWHNPDHINNPRRRVSQMAYYARKAIDAEIASCTPLCRRCHMAEDGRLVALVAQAGRANVASRTAHRRRPATQTGTNVSEALALACCMH